jgi:hypothetical protein
MPKPCNGPKRVQRLQNHEVQCPLQDFRCFPVHPPVHPPLSAVTAPSVLWTLQMSVALLRVQCP